VSRGGRRWRTWAGGRWMESRPARRQLYSLAGALSSLVLAQSLANSPTAQSHHHRLSREVVSHCKTK
jgi:hypothetical protein